MTRLPRRVPRLRRVRETARHRWGVASPLAGAAVRIAATAVALAAFAGCATLPATVQPEIMLADDERAALERTFGAEGTLIARLAAAEGAPPTAIVVRPEVAPPVVREALSGVGISGALLRRTERITVLAPVEAPAWYTVARERGDAPPVAEPLGEVVLDWRVGRAAASITLARSPWKRASHRLWSDPGSGAVLYLESREIARLVLPAPPRLEGPRPAASPALERLASLIRFGDAAASGLALWSVVPAAPLGRLEPRSVLLTIDAGSEAVVVFEYDDERSARVALTTLRLALPRLAAPFGLTVGPAFDVTRAGSLVRVVGLNVSGVAPAVFSADESTE